MALTDRLLGWQALHSSPLHPHSKQKLWALLGRVILRHLDWSLSSAIASCVTLDKLFKSKWPVKWGVSSPSKASRGEIHYYLAILLSMCPARGMSCDSHYWDRVTALLTHLPNVKIKSLSKAICLGHTPKKATHPLLHYGSWDYCLWYSIAPMWSSLEARPCGLVFGPGLHRIIC